VTAVGQAGGVLLTETVKAVGLDTALIETLSPWRGDSAVHDPAKVVLDLAICLVLGGDGLNDVRLLRAEPDVYGLVASDATVSRAISKLAAHGPAALAAIRKARATARNRAWNLAGAKAVNASASSSDPMIIDVDATIVVAHSEKDGAAPTWKKTFGFHPIAAFIDHGKEGTGEPLAICLRKGNAGSNTVADHIKVIKLALAQLPTRERKNVLIRTDGAGGTQELAKYLTKRGLNYSVGFTLPMNTPQLYHLLPEEVWTPTLTADGNAHDTGEVAEFTGVMNLTGWPPDMRVIVRRERPHPGAQLRFDDVDGYRLTAFATNTQMGQHQQLELRHRNRARVEDRVRTGKNCGLAKMPLQSFEQNQIWCEIIALACDILAWMQTIALNGHAARRWEPKTLRLRLFSIPAQLAHRARQVRLYLGQHWPWAELINQGLARLRPPAFTPG
jgi:hypothetical protein